MTVLNLCIPLCWRVNKGRLTTVKTQLYKNNKLSATCFDPLGVIFRLIFEISLDLVSLISNDNLKFMHPAVLENKQGHINGSQNTNL